MSFVSFLKSFERSQRIDAVLINPRLIQDSANRAAIYKITPKRLPEASQFLQLSKALPEAFLIPLYLWDKLH